MADRGDELRAASLPSRATAVLLLGLLGGPDAASAVSPSGSQFQINSYTTANETSVQVSSHAAGGQFQVNTYTTSTLTTYPSVASDAAGDFVVVWTSGGSTGGDTDSNSVLGQAYAADGSALGGEFQVNSFTTSYQGGGSVASNPPGTFVVGWRSFGGYGDDSIPASMQGQRFVPEPSFAQSFGATLAVLAALARLRRLGQSDSIASRKRSANRSSVNSRR